MKGVCRVPGTPRVDDRDRYSASRERTGPYIHLTFGLDAATLLSRWVLVNSDYVPVGEDHSDLWGHVGQIIASQQGRRQKAQREK